jgi:formate/nitrite transporter FocA (FNT family)
MRTGTGLRPSPGTRGEPELEDAFDRLVSEGRDRLQRPLISLVATGILGGIDVGVGVLACLVVNHETGPAVAGCRGFHRRIHSAADGRSELFTENFLVPVTARVAGYGSWVQLGRLWLVTLAANLAGGFVMAAMVIVSVPGLRVTAGSLGTHYARLGISWRSLLLAVLAGVVITLMTRMQHATEDFGPRLVAAVAMSFILWVPSCSTRCWIRSSCSPV